MCVCERERDKALKCEWYRFVRIYFHLDSISPIRQIYLTHSNKTVSLCVAWCWCFHDVFTIIYIEAYSPPLVLMNIWKKRVFLREELDIHNTTTRMTLTFYDAVRRKKITSKASNFRQLILSIISSGCCCFFASARKCVSLLPHCLIRWWRRPLIASKVELF